MRGRRSTELEAVPLTVVVTCQWCGGRVELTSVDGATEIQDPAAFVAQHRECLRQRPPAG